MKVTDVRLRKIQTDGRMKALVSITFEVVPDKNATSEDSEEA